MHIKSLEVKNFRSIREFKMKFDTPAGWHVLIGDNGSGKSSILKALSLAIMGPQEATALRIDLNNFIYFNEQEARVAIQILKHDRDKQKGQSAPLKKPFGAAIMLETTEQGSIKTGRISQDGKSLYPKRYIWNSLRGWFSAAFGPFRRFSGGNKDWGKLYYSNPRAASHLSVFGEDVALTESLEWLSELNYKRLEQDAEAEKTLDFIKRFINEGDLLPHGAKFVRASSEGVYLEDGNGQQVSVTEMSDGFRSVLNMTFEIIRQMILNFGVNDVFEESAEGIRISVEGVVMIDEVDAHLHPTWQTRIGNWFTQYFPKVQFIVTTHSPLICRASENGTIWRLSAPGGDLADQGEITGTERQQLIVGNILDAYGTELFGKSPVRSPKNEAGLERLGNLNIKYALDKLTEPEAQERLQLMTTFSTDDPTGF